MRATRAGWRWAARAPRTITVRVLFKILVELGFEVGDLPVEFGDDADGGAGGGRDRIGRSELLGAQRGLDLPSSGVQVTAEHRELMP